VVFLVLSEAKEQSWYGVLAKAFGSSKSGAVLKPAAQSKSPVQSSAAAPSVFCDGCNQPASFATDTYFTASEFVTLVKKGLKPHQSVFFLTQVSGISREAFIAVLPDQITAISGC
jgi:hypothetical protein